MSGDALEALARELGLPAPFPAVGDYRRIAAAIARRTGEGRLLVGICGPQGSGKSTMAAFLAALLEERGLSTARLSLDDLYLDPEDRPIGIHPLFATRGAPGTHDVALGLEVIDRLFAAGGAIPRFDKARDRRRPVSEWEHFPRSARIVLLEGWCVGAEPEDDAALTTSVNRLEAEEDASGTWRRHVNSRLAGDYRMLFGRVGYLVYLRAPSFDCVLRWRSLQERKLQARHGKQAGMPAAALPRFISHYERLTRHLAATLPAKADILVELDEAQAIAAIVVSDNDVD